MTGFDDRLLSMKSGEAIFLGSDPGCDFTFSGEAISGKHARIDHDDGAWFVRDLDSHDGLFLNDAPVRGRHRLRDGDRLTLGNVTLTLRLRPTNVGTPTPADNGTSVTLKHTTNTVSVRTGLSKAPKSILEDVSLHIHSGEFVGILGASGSGKSTVMKTIAGLIDRTDGDVMLDGTPRSHNHLQSDQRIAYMPQDIIIHEELTPRKALGYSAQLKKIGGSAADRARLVQQALDRVGVGACIDIPIRKLSGGQRKRVALASELLGEPHLILLDEATSGLDPATEGDMMHLFRSLADDGRTVICITHFPGHLTLCDRVLFLKDGKVVFFGPPDELVSFFGAESMEDVYVQQSKKSAEEWRTQFKSTPIGRAVDQEVEAIIPVQATERQAFRPQPEGIMEHAGVLTLRYVDLLLSDWKNVAFLLSQALIIGLMLALTFGMIRAPFAEQHAANTKEVLFVVVLAVLWCAGTVSVREIVREETILKHENRFGVRIAPYLLSKIVPLTVLSFLQAGLLLAHVKYFTELTGAFATQYTLLAATGFVGVLLGLLISAFVGSVDRAMTALPIVLIAQAIFSGGVAKISGIVEALAMGFVPAYWALEGLRSTFSAQLTMAGFPGPPGEPTPTILGSGVPFGIALIALTIQGILLFGATYVFLSKKVNGLALPNILGSVHNRLIRFKGFPRGDKSLDAGNLTRPHS